MRNLKGMDLIILSLRPILILITIPSSLDAQIQAQTPLTQRLFCSLNQLVPHFPVSIFSYNQSNSDQSDFQCMKSIFLVKRNKPQLPFYPFKTLRFLENSSLPRGGGLPSWHTPYCKAILFYKLNRLLVFLTEYLQNSCSFFYLEQINSYHDNLF